MLWDDGGCPPCSSPGSDLWDAGDNVFAILGMQEEDCHEDFNPVFQTVLMDTWSQAADGLPAAPSSETTTPPEPIVTPPEATVAPHGIFPAPAVEAATTPPPALSRFDELPPTETGGMETVEPSCQTVEPCCQTVEPCYQAYTTLPVDELGPTTDPTNWEDHGMVEVPTFCSDELGPPTEMVECEKQEDADCKAPTMRCATRPPKRSVYDTKPEEGVKSEGIKEEGGAHRAKRCKAEAVKDEASAAPPPRAKRGGASRGQSMPVVHLRERKSTNVKDEVVIRRSIEQGLGDGSWVVQEHVVIKPDPGRGIPELIGIRELVPGSIFMRTSEAVLRNDSAKEEERAQVELAWLRSKVLHQGPAIEALVRKNSLGKEIDNCSKKVKQSLERAYLTPAVFKHDKEKGKNSNPAAIWRTPDWKMPRAWAFEGYEEDA